VSDATLREVVAALAPLERGAGSRGETEAADWLAARLRAAGAPARVEAVRFHDGFARLMLPLGAIGTVAGLVSLTGRARRATALVAGLVGFAVADDADNRWRIWRRLTTRSKATTNVIAEVGDLGAQRTLVMLAHHDAAPTGMVFDQSFQRGLARYAPWLVRRLDTSLPLWWPIIGAPLLVALGALTGRRALTLTGMAGGMMNTVLAADIARNRIVPGANDNLSAVAALVALAERLRDRPIEGLRVVLVSCGAEEVLQGGIYDYVERHLTQLDPSSTWVLNLDTVGSPHLIMLEGEGIIRIEDYPGPAFRDLVAAAAQDAGVPLIRGQRSRTSTDSVIPARAGYPIATIASYDPDTKLLSNYHLPTDTPENLDFGTVSEAVELADTLARRLATGV